jgi:hypothetical protein
MTLQLTSPRCLRPRLTGPSPFGRPAAGWCSSGEWVRLSQPQWRWLSGGWDSRTTILIRRALSLRSVVTLNPRRGLSSCPHPLNPRRGLSSCPHRSRSHPNSPRPRPAPAVDRHLRTHRRGLSSCVCLLAQTRPTTPSPIARRLQNPKPAPEACPLSPHLASPILSRHIPSTPPPAAMLLDSRREPF